MSLLLLLDALSQVATKLHWLKSYESFDVHEVEHLYLIY